MYLQKFEIKKKTALVTGAGKGIGKASAIALAEAGADLIILSRTKSDLDKVKKQIVKLKRNCQIYVCDVSNYDEVKSVFKEIKKIDILINNAAIRPSKPFLEMTDADWHNVLDIDLNSAFYTCRAFAGGMLENGWGRIVNITGMNAIHGYKGRAPVSAAKHGLWGLTKSLGKEFGSGGITANAISPGPIDTDGDHAQREHILSMVPRVPIGRLGKPEEIAALTGFLCSNGGAFVNGQMINCNGGTET